jgi:trehalose 6-phosphate phosphatase
LRHDKVLAPLQLNDAAGCALFLDLDGTLIDIAPTPDRVQIPPDLVSLLRGLSAGLKGALAIVTGRKIVEINQFLDPLRLAAAGVHGAELRPAADGEILLTVGPIDPVVAAAVQRVSALTPGIIIEEKVYSIAVHYRMAAAAEPQIKAALQAILATSPDHFILCPGRCVIEVVPRHVSKGSAVEALMAQPAFQGRRPIMIGDDVPDESALAAAVRRGGHGLRVAGEHFSAAVADFASPAAVRSWLASLVARL